MSYLPKHKHWAMRPAGGVKWALWLLGALVAGAILLGCDSGPAAPAEVESPFQVYTEVVTEPTPGAIGVFKVVGENPTARDATLRADVTFSGCPGGQFAGQDTTVTAVEPMPPLNVQVLQGFSPHGFGVHVRSTVSDAGLAEGDEGSGLLPPASVDTLLIRCS